MALVAILGNSQVGERQIDCHATLENFLRYYLKIIDKELSKIIEFLYSMILWWILLYIFVNPTEVGEF